MSPQVLPVRMYRTADRIMVAAPMPGLEPTDITVTVDGDRVTIAGNARGPHQHQCDLILAEWTIGPYYRELALLHPVRADLVNATYDNGVLVLVMPTLDTGQPRLRAEIRLEPIEATRGEHVGHAGRSPRPTTTPEHQIGKHKTSPASPRTGEGGGITPPLK